jgi:N-dimethylarginine dimethylaminohydrolase
LTSHDLVIADRQPAFIIISLSLFFELLLRCNNQDNNKAAGKLRAMTERDKKWNKQYEKLVEFKQNNGHCVVPQKCKEDKSLGKWVSKQRTSYTNKVICRDRKDLLDALEFVWQDDRTAARVSGEDKKWNKQHEKLVEFKQKNGHCIVPQRCKEDKSLGKWVNTQRTFHTKKNMRQD